MISAGLMRPARRIEGKVVGQPPQHLLIATNRPAVYEFFAALADASDCVDVAVDALDSPAVAAATAAIVDAGLDGASAVELCKALRVQRPELPLTAVVCCPHALTPWLFRALVAAGVESLLDLETTATEAAGALRRVARGESVLELRFGMRKLVLLRDLLAGHGLRQESQALLEHVARGLSDQEIGQQLHLSPHTIKKHIEQLRDQLGARNRIELAAWAGRQGLYSPNGAVQRFIR
jgi:DNA-binding NarL/FixJ family response regulator